MKRILLALFLCTGCMTSLPVSGVYSVGKDAANQCVQHCEGLDLRFAALVIMANSTGCICEPKDDPPQAHARLLSHAAGALQIADKLVEPVRPRNAIEMGGGGVGAGGNR